MNGSCIRQWRLLLPLCDNCLVNIALLSEYDASYRTLVLAERVHPALDFDCDLEAVDAHSFQKTDVRIHRLLYAANHSLLTSASQDVESEVVFEVQFRNQVHTHGSVTVFPKHHSDTGTFKRGVWRRPSMAIARLPGIAASLAAMLLK